MGITILLFSNVKQYFKSDYTPAALTRKRPHLYHSPFMANSDVASNSRNTMKWLIRHCIEPTHNCVHAYKVRSRPFTNVNQKPWLECQIFCYSTNCQLEAGTASFYWKFRNGFFVRFVHWIYLMNHSVFIFAATYSVPFVPSVCAFEINNCECLWTKMGMAAFCSLTAYSLFFLLPRITVDSFLLLPLMLWFRVRL